MNLSRSSDHSPWFWCSKAARRKALEAADSNGLLVYLALCELESNAPKEFKGAFLASRANIKAVCGLSIKTIERILPVLQKAGLFRMESGRSSEKGKANEANKYTLLDTGPYSQGDATKRQADASPSVIQNGQNDAHKRTFFNGVKKKGQAKSEKQPGSAEASPDESGRFFDPGPGKRTAQQAIDLVLNSWMRE